MSKLGVLLIHGFTSHRSSLEVLIPKLDALGLEWHYPILAGHGSKPEDLVGKNWKHWQSDVELGLHYLMQSNNRVVIIALSMGTLLALELAAKYPNQIAGLVLLSPCTIFRSRLSTFTPVISKFMKKFPNPAIGKFSHVNYAKHDRGYQWFPTSAYASYWHHARAIDDVVRQVYCPALIIQSSKDLIAHPRGAQKMYDLLCGPKKILRHEHSGHELLLDCETEAIVEEIFSFPELKP